MEAGGGEGEDYGDPSLHAPGTELCTPGSDRQAEREKAATLFNCVALADTVQGYKGKPSSGSQTSANAPRGFRPQGQNSLPPLLQSFPDHRALSDSALLEETTTGSR